MVDVATGRPIRPPLSVGGVPADSLDLSPDGRLLAAATFDGSVFVWDAKTGEPYGSPLTVDTSPVNEVAFSPDGRTLVSAHQDRRSSGTWTGSRRSESRSTEGSISPPTCPSAPTASGSSPGSSTGTWSSTTRRRDDRPVCSHVDSIVTSVAFAPDGKHVAVGTIDGRVRLFDPSTRATVGLPLDVGKAAVWQVAFSPDGRLLAVAVDPNGGGDGFYAQQRQGEVQLWDVGSRSPVGEDDRAGRRIGVRRGLQPGRHAAGDRQRRAARPVGRGDPGTSRTAHESLGRRCPERRVRSDRPARRRRRCDRPGARLARRGSAPGVPSPRRTHRPVTGAAFDASGSFLATTSLFGGTRLWDPRHGPPVTATSWPEARGPARLERRPSTFRSWACATRSARTASCWPSRESRRSGCCGTSIPALWRERACAIVGRNLSREEWNLYLPAGTAYRATCSEWPTG